MAGTFDRYNDLRDNVPGAYQALLYCITHDVCVSGRCVEWLIDEHFELVSDEYYVDFDDASRWSIGKAYILSLDDGFYRLLDVVVVHRDGETHLLVERHLFGGAAIHVDVSALLSASQRVGDGDLVDLAVEQ